MAGLSDREIEEIARRIAADIAHGGATFPTTDNRQPTTELMDPRNFQYMFYGFSAAWVLIVIYALTLLARESKIKDEITRLKSMMEERGRK